MCRTPDDSRGLATAPEFAPDIIPDFHPAIAELIDLDQWVFWKLIDGDKPPLSPHSGRKCSHSNPDHWSTYDQAIAAAARYAAAGIGFVFHESNPYSGIDLDGCRNQETGAIEPWAQRTIDMCDSYTEISPSGTGVKIWVRGTLPETIKKSFGPHIGIEIYSKQRYFTVTGQHLAGTPTEIRDAQYALDLLWAELRPKPTPRPAPTAAPKISLGEAAAERQSARDVAERFNGTNDLGDLLERYGAPYVRAAGDSRYYGGIADDTHSHDVTYIVSPAKSGSGQIGYSYSPNGKLNNVDFRRGFRPFDVIVALEYGGSVIATLKALNPLPPRRPPPPEPPRYRTKAQEQDATRKRAKRQETAAAILDDVRARSAEDTTLTPCDRAVLDALLAIAGGRSWCRPSKARIAEQSGYSLGGVKRSLMVLESRGYFSSAGDGGRPDQTAIRTFLRGSSNDTETIFVSKDDPRIYIASNDSTLNPVACEALPPAPASTQPAERMALCNELLSKDDAAFAAWFASHAQPPAAEPEPAGASYTPVELRSDAPYSGISKHTLDTTARYALVWASMRRQPDADDSDHAEQLEICAMGSSTRLIVRARSPARRASLSVSAVQVAFL